MARVHPVRVGNSEGDWTENRALFTLLIDRTQGYRFLCKDMEVRSLLLLLSVIEIIINYIRDGMGGSPMSCFPRAGQNFSFLADLP